jgi:hypothetical protein
MNERNCAFQSLCLMAGHAVFFASLLEAFESAFHLAHTDPHMRSYFNRPSLAI